MDIWNELAAEGVNKGLLEEIKAFRSAHPVPEEARIFKTVTCSVCGERFAESFAHLQNGEIVCSACYRPYTRGL